MKLSTKARNAVFLGSLCSVSYLAVYIARNLLGAVTPKMTADAFTLDYIGEITAVYLIAYATGQLINGAIGDRIKAKYMISAGLLMAGIANLVFVQLSGHPYSAMIAYGWTGFSLSMIYGPMTKMVAESTDLVYATRCSLGYTFASFFGSPMAGLIATFLTWQATFNVSSIMLVVMAITAFCFFTAFEKRGIIKYQTPEQGTTRPKKDYKGLFKRSIVKFSGISMLTGIIRTSFVGFLSTYFYAYLKYSESESASIFSIVTFIICFTAFIAIFVYEKLGRNMHVSALIFFIISAVAFLASCFAEIPVTNIAIIVIAIMASNAASTMLWSVYCPSMRDTGLVSTITGFLDFLSYSAAALASLLIPRIADVIGWRSIIFIMSSLMFIGIAICVPHFCAKNRVDLKGLT